MARLGDIAVDFLTQKHLQQYPVWAEDERTDELRPVLDTNPLPDNMGLLLIRASFETPDGLALHGHVTWHFRVYAFAVFVHEQKVWFNLNMNTQSITESVQKLREALGLGDIRIFPLKYWTEHHVENDSNLAGVFDPK